MPHLRIQFREGLDELTSAHLEILGLHIHLDQGISNQVPESAAVEVAVPPAVVAGVIDLGELQAPNFLKALRVEIFVCAPDLGEMCRNYSRVGSAWTGLAPPTTTQPKVVKALRYRAGTAA